MEKTQIELGLGLEIMTFTLASVEMNQDPRAKVIMLKSLQSQTEMALKLAEAIVAGVEFNDVAFINEHNSRLNALHREMAALRAENDAKKLAESELN